MSCSVALILIGFQNDYFAADGILRSVIDQAVPVDRILDSTVQVVRGAIAHGVPTIATPIFFTPTYEELVDPVGILKTVRDVGAFQAGQKGSEMVEALLPFQDQIWVVPGKRGLNAFTGTSLHELLQKHQITQIVLAGAVTSVCIDSTGRAAHEKGYRVSVLADCTCARTQFEQEFYLENVFPLYANVISAESFLESLADV
ncbi:MAG: cysteine hydrolase family protein [Limnothrix sp. BL-A-16]|jgi:nicotinamidase-related amidase